jgi:osmotically-inducible protein OsmY
MSTRRRPPARDLVIVTGCVVVGLLNPPTRAPDHLLERKIRARLAGDPVAGRLSLDVTASGGVATVTGRIQDSSQARRALTTVSETSGVMDVIDDLRWSDDVITRNVTAAFGTDPMVSAVPVSVRCVDGEVTLLSTQTNEDQRKRLVQLAAAVDGVVHVVDAMK